MCEIVLIGVAVYVFWKANQHFPVELKQSTCPRHVWEYVRDRAGKYRTMECIECGKQMYGE